MRVAAPGRDHWRRRFRRDAFDLAPEIAVQHEVADHQGPGVGGKTLGFNIPTIPALAAGGIATAPTLAQIGEGGEPEAVLPLSKLAALLDEWTKPKPTPGGGTGGGGETVVFSPVFNFYGGTPSREEAEEAGRISFAEFKKLYRQMKAEEKRKQFSPA